MDHRAHVYSPLQNVAVWLAAWLHGQVSSDECLDALMALGGRVHLAGTHPEAPDAGIDVLKAVRRIGEDALASDEPSIQLVLTGPGEALGLRAGSESARAAIESGVGALVFPGTDRFQHHILVPRNTGAGSWEFTVFAENQLLPAPAYLSPGEADLLLTEATREAARLIELNGAAPADLPNPRLTVGMLSDFYDTPGLPFCTPPRAAKLFARADRVAAIIETVSTHVGDRALDPLLLPLMRHVRAARVAGVSHAVLELSRA
ncbi:hypothetical protein CKALI_05870 [Corynebacterium kalinowskii]|uniref:Uncharacterized protein n=2 Tax=Corynebacterium kalinowskii TaxID=2675216 RepID=A0A6B8VD07_9CORY|nr:hypothetical protein CKALI_05870 [Corynebacterium kalinowskii]